MAWTNYLISTGVGLLTGAFGGPYIRLTQTQGALLGGALGAGGAARACLSELMGMKAYRVNNNNIKRYTKCDYCCFIQNSNTNDHVKFNSISPRLLAKKMKSCIDYQFKRFDEYLWFYMFATNRINMNFVQKLMYTELEIYEKFFSKVMNKNVILSKTSFDMDLESLETKLWRK